MKKVLFTLLLFSFTYVLYAADTNDVKIKFGVYGGLNMNFHFSDFQELAECPNCFQDFQSAFGAGPAMGALVEYPVYENKMFAGVRLGYSNLDGKFLENEKTTVMQGDRAVSGNFEHVINSEFNVFGIDYYVNYNAWKDLFIHIGGSSQFFDHAYFDQYEKITSPESATFIEDGEDTYSKFRNEFEVDLLDSDVEEVAGLYQSIILGASYELPLNKRKTLVAAPGINYSLPLTDVLEDKSWKISPLRMEVAFKYNLRERTEPDIEYREQEIIDTISQSEDMITERMFKTGQPQISYDTLTTQDKKIITMQTLRVDTLFYPKDYEIYAEVSASGITSQNEIIENPQLIIEEFYSVKMQPILNYVFFDEENTRIPDRFVKLKSDQAEDFKINDLFAEETMTVYYNLLNITGYRLKKNPGAGITIRGYSGGKDKSKQIAASRAQNVKDYLTDVWNIEENRISIETGNLPPKPSTPLDEPEKVAENNRVELYSNNDIIFQPVELMDTLRQSSPPVVRFDLETNAEAGVKEGNLIITQKGRELLNADVMDVKNEYFEWAVTKNSKNTPKFDEPLTYMLHVEDKAGNDYRTEKKQLNVTVKTIAEKRRQMIDDKEFEKFSLILFDFDKSIIENENQEIINMIKERIKPESEVQIIGYTDKTGDPAYNKELSRRRAKAAYEALGINDAEYKGIGEQKVLYNNELPEGRFYSRIVEITIVTPVEY